MLNWTTKACWWRMAVILWLLHPTFSDRATHWAGWTQGLLERSESGEVFAGAKLVHPDHDVWIIYGDGSAAYSLMRVQALSCGISFR